MFEQYAAILHQKYPEISVEGDMYPPPDYKVMLARAMVCDQICIQLFYMYLNSTGSTHVWSSHSVTQQLLMMKYSRVHSVFIVETCNIKLFEKCKDCSQS